MHSPRGIVTLLQMTTVTITCQHEPAFLKNTNNVTNKPKTTTTKLIAFDALTSRYCDFAADDDSNNRLSARTCFPQKVQ